jgi:hypothetical protein
MKTNTTNKTELYNLMNKLFSNCKQINGNYIAGIEETDRQKTKHISRIKDFCSSKFETYILSIVFIGGISSEYQTAIKIEIE